MGFVKEFKDFAMKGNLVDMAVAFVMGAGFSKVVSAFIDGVFMPLVSMITGGVDFNDMKYILKVSKDAIKDVDGNVVTEAIPELVVKYGTFITVSIEFLVVAFVMFMLIKSLNSMKKKEDTAPSAPPAPSNEEVLLGEIRDLLKK